MTYLAICAVYRDEAPYLREWIEFHRLVGVERFYLYNNGSSDDHHAVIAPYVEAGVVVAHEWPAVLPPHVSAGDAAQCAVYQDCILRHGPEARWIAFLDLDEFLFSPTGAALSELLPEYERWPGVGVNWAVFGTSGHESMPAGLVIENYVRRAEARGYNRPIKCIVDPDRVRSFCLAHFFMFHGEPGVVVDENHRPVTASPGSPLSMTDEVSFAKFRLNHYATKSVAEYRQKMTRVRVDNGQPRDLSEGQVARLLEATDAVEDRTIQMYLPALRDALGAIV